jgi:hypothetical protein
MSTQQTIEPPYLFRAENGFTVAVLAHSRSHAQEYVRWGGGGHPWYRALRFQGREDPGDSAGVLWVRLLPCGCLLCPGQGACRG